jgi:hypothetical protein
MIEMVEVIYRDSNNKMLMMVIGKVCYRNDCYVIYSIKRDNEDVNLFVSKLVQNSQGYVLDDCFSNGEKEVLDGFIKRLLSRESRDILEEDGFSIDSDISLDGNLFFDIDACYVTTISRKVLKEILIFYQLVRPELFEQPVVEVVADKRKFNEGFAVNIGIILFGLVVVIFSIVVIVEVLVG